MIDGDLVSDLSCLNDINITKDNVSSAQINK